MSLLPGSYNVLSSSADRIMFQVGPVEKASLLRRHFADELPGTNFIRLRPVTQRSVIAGERHTSTSRGPFMGAVGRSQDYTTRDDKRRVDGFKTIWPEHRHFFHAATLGIVDI